MKSTFNICFYAKKDKQKAGGAYPLFARITVDGVASRFNTKLDVLPEMWDGKAGKAIGRTAEAGRINRMLSDINASLNTIYHEMQRRDNYVTAEKVKNEFLGHSENHETILTLFQKHNEDVKQLVGISKTAWYGNCIHSTPTEYVRKALSFPVLLSLSQLLQSLFRQLTQ